MHAKLIRSSCVQGVFAEPYLGRSNEYRCNTQAATRRQFMQAFGPELEEVYARVLGGIVNSRERDCGRDIEFRDPMNPRLTVGVQVKAAYYQKEVIPFLARALRSAQDHGRTWTNFCIGEPPAGSDSDAKLAILESFEFYGAWVESGYHGRDSILRGFGLIRDRFPPDKVQKVFLVAHARPALALC